MSCTIFGAKTNSATVPGPFCLLIVKTEKTERYKCIFKRCVDCKDSALYIWLHQQEKLMPLPECMCVCICVITVSLLRKTGSRTQPIINPQSLARSLSQLCVWQSGTNKKQLLLWIHTAHTTHTAVIAHAHTHTHTHTHKCANPFQPSCVNTQIVTFWLIR